MILVETILFLIILIRKLWSRRIVFFTYLGWSIFSDGVFLYLGVRHLKVTLTPYIIELAVDSLLQFFVIAEIAWSTIKPLKNVLPRHILPVVLLMLAAIGVFCWPFANMVVLDNLKTHGHLMLVLNQTVAILRIAFFLLLAAFSQFLSIGWRDRELQIASGLGFYAGVSLVVAIVHSHGMVGPRYHWLDLVTSLGYLGTLTYWVVCFSIKEPEIRKISPQMQRFLVSIGGTVHADRFALETAIQKKPGKHSHL